MHEECQEMTPYYILSGMCSLIFFVFIDQYEDRSFTVGNLLLILNFLIGLPGLIIIAIFTIILIGSFILIEKTLKFEIIKKDYQDMSNINTIVEMSKANNKLIEEIQKLKSLLLEAVKWTDHDDNLEQPFDKYCYNIENNCLKCKINKEL